MFPTDKEAEAASAANGGASSSSLNNVSHNVPMTAMTSQPQSTATVNQQLYHPGAVDTKASNGQVDGAAGGGAPVQASQPMEGQYGGHAVAPPPGLEYLATLDKVSIHQVLHVVEGTVLFTYLSFI